MSDYAHPEVLVTTEWVAAHSKDAGLRVVEVDVDTTAYDQATWKAPSPGTGKPNCRTPSAAISRSRPPSRNCSAKRASLPKQLSSSTGITTIGPPPGHSGK